MPSSADVSQQLTQIDARLQAIDNEKQVLLYQRKSLVGQYEAELAQNFKKYASAAAKVTLFISYFKGRPDIYAFRWENKQGRSGYSPACFNEWQQGICNKPNIKCTDCLNQAFMPYNYD